MRSILEKAIVHLLNDEKDEADRLFHQFMVERSRQIHESLRNGEDVSLKEGWDDELASEEYFTEDDLDDAEDGEGAEDAADDLGDDLEADADADMDDEAMDDEAMADDSMDDMDMDADADTDADEMGDAGEGDLDGRIDDIEDQIDDIEDQIERLTAEFEEMMSKMGEGDDADDMDADADADMDADDADMDDADDADMDDMDDADMDDADADKDEDSEDVKEMFFFDPKDGRSRKEISADRPKDKLAARPEQGIAKHPEDYKDMMADPKMRKAYAAGGPKGKLPESEDDEFDDITESVLAELDKVDVSMTDAEVGDGKPVAQNNKSPIPQRKASDRNGAKPFELKSDHHAGHEREPAPAVKDMKARKNVRRKSTDGMGAVKK